MKGNISVAFYFVPACFHHQNLPYEVLMMQCLEEWHHPPINWHVSLWASDSWHLGDIPISSATDAASHSLFREPGLHMYPRRFVLRSKHWRCRTPIVFLTDFLIIFIRGPSTYLFKLVPESTSNFHQNWLGWSAGHAGKKLLKRNCSWIMRQQIWRGALKMDARLILYNALAYWD